MPARNDDGGRAHFDQTLGRPPPIVGRMNPATAQHFGLGDVRGDHAGAREQLETERAHAILVEQALRRSTTPSPDRGPPPAALSSSIAAATASTIAAVASMPIFVASMRMSRATASICAVTRSAGNGATAVTPRVFCAVTAVMALVPYTPNAAKVFRSAWMPAPPLESLPAMVSAWRIGVTGDARGGVAGLPKISRNWNGFTSRFTCDQHEAGGGRRFDHRLGIDPLIPRRSGSAVAWIEIHDADSAVRFE